MEEFLGQLREFGVRRLVAITGVTIGAALALVLIAGRITTENLGVLYSELSYADGQSIVERLEQDNIRYDMRERGGAVTILAPRERIPDLKLKLAADGIVVKQGVGWEIFDETDTFGATTFQQNINRLRALEGELARTISTIAGVRSARVHLVLPERELFSRERNNATASIVVDAPAGIDRRSVKAIVNLAASAVPQLDPSNVTVLDSTGALLASGKGDEFGAGGVDERVQETETRLRRTVEQIVGRIVGQENVRVEVAAELDYARVTEQSETIDPDSQTVLSSTIIEEAANDRDPALSRGVTVANALPTADAVDPASVDAATSSNRRTEETTNYEMSRTVRNEVREHGGLKRLSVAVALNEGPNGPRSQEALQQLTALVRSAVGFNAARGDQVEIVEMQFSPVASSPEAGVAASSPSALSNDLLMRIGEIAALALIAIALIVFVLRPIFSDSGAKAAATSSGANATVKQIENLPQRSAGTELLAPQDSDFERRIDLAQVDGQVRASSIRKVADVVKNHTDDSAAILKTWIREAS